MAGGFFNYGSFAGPVELEPIYALVDLETSGFNPPQAKILEIAILKIDAQGKVLDQFSTLIDPGDNNVGRTEIHGITLEMIKKAPSFAEVREAKFLKFWEVPFWWPIMQCLKNDSWKLN